MFLFFTSSYESLHISVSRCSTLLRRDSDDDLDMHYPVANYPTLDSNTFTSVMAKIPLCAHFNGWVLLIIIPSGFASRARGKVSS